jgi:hypothetical protein
MQVENGFNEDAGLIHDSVGSLPDARAEPAARTKRAIALLYLPRIRQNTPILTPAAETCLLRRWGKIRSRGRRNRA